MAELEPKAQPPAGAAEEPLEDDDDDFEELEPDLKGLVEYVARALVDKPEAVKVDEVPDGNTTVYELEVDEEDIGKVIGRQGRVVRGLRALVKAAATRKGTRVDLDVV
jgi:predicted RNA-binding protein YlqC (UPF0109 family)